MTPTPRLRFVERDSYSKNGEHFAQPFKMKILQQWWESEWDGAWVTQTEFRPTGEWRDVPVEKEA